MDLVSIVRALLDAGADVRVRTGSKEKRVLNFTDGRRGYDVPVKRIQEINDLYYCTRNFRKTTLENNAYIRVECYFLVRDMKGAVTKISNGLSHEFQITNEVPDAASLRSVPGATECSIYYRKIDLESLPRENVGGVQYGAIKWQQAYHPPKYGPSKNVPTEAAKKKTRSRRLRRATSALSGNLTPQWHRRLPEGWTRVKSRSREGKFSYYNIHTRKRQKNVPTEAALCPWTDLDANTAIILELLFSIYDEYSSWFIGDCEFDHIGKEWHATMHRIATRDEQDDPNIVTHPINSMNPVRKSRWGFDSRRGVKRKNKHIVDLLFRRVPSRNEHRVLDRDHPGWLEKAVAPKKEAVSRIHKFWEDATYNPKYKHARKTICKKICDDGDAKCQASCEAGAWENDVRQTHAVLEEHEYEIAIACAMRPIIAAADLETLTKKMLRQQLEALLGKEIIAPRNDFIKKTMLSMARTKYALEETKMAAAAAAKKPGPAKKKDTKKKNKDTKKKKKDTKKKRRRSSDRSKSSGKKG